MMIYTLTKNTWREIAEKLGKIQAIKAYWAIYEKGLLESKNFICDLMDNKEVNYSDFEIEKEDLLHRLAKAYLSDYITDYETFATILAVIVKSSYEACFIFIKNFNFKHRINIFEKSMKVVKLNINEVDYSISLEENGDVVLQVSSGLPEFLICAGKITVKIPEKSVDSMPTK